MRALSGETSKMGFGGSGEDLTAELSSTTYIEPPRTEKEAGNLYDHFWRCFRRSLSDPRDMSFIENF
jgi:hypothetical protein